MQHYGLGLKMLANEKKGDGIMSAIDIFVSMDMIKGKMDEDRFVITLNGKFLPHLEQLTENNTAALGQKKE
jgi:cyanate lyase